MVIQSLYPSVPVPDTDLFSLLLEKPHRRAPDDKELFICGGSGRSYSQATLREAAVKFGKGLRSQWGFKKGDVLGVFSPNSVDYPAVVFGALWAGGTLSTANPTYTTKELAFQLKDSKVKGLVTLLALLPKAVEAAALAGVPADRIILMDDARDASGKVPHFTDLKDTSLLGQSRVKVDGKKDLAFLCYSSGTTGLPKGVMLTHENIIANIVTVSSVEDLCGLAPTGGLDGLGDKQVAVLPFFHVYGLTCILLAVLYTGFQTVILPAFELERFLTVIQKHHISFIYLPPPVILALAKHPLVDKFDVSSLKWINSGAAPLTKELVDGVWKRLALPVKQGYGLSEASPVTHMQEILDFAKYKGSIGRLIPNMTAKIVDMEGKELASGEEGELWVKGPNVFRGYLNRPELKDTTFSDDGYLRTGDIAYIDKKGNFYITDRLKELIKYKGFQVAPAELEGTLQGHDDVADAAVVPAFDHERSTEVPRAYVVLRAGVPRTDDKAREIVEWVAGKVAPHKQLRGGIRFIDQVPKNASGKILRRVLKEEAKKEDRAKGAKL